MKIISKMNLLIAYQAVLVVFYAHTGALWRING